MKGSAKEMDSVRSASSFSLSSVSSSSTTSSIPEGIYEIRDCPANATKIMLNFQSMTDREFLIRIEAPSGESSPLLYLAGAGALQRFSPTKNGCGHGNWKIEVFCIEEYGRYHRVRTVKHFVDGTGSLYFFVKDDLNLVLKKQAWSPIPENACCRKYRFFIGK